MGTERPRRPPVSNREIKGGNGLVRPRPRLGRRNGLSAAVRLGPATVGIGAGHSIASAIEDFTLDVAPSPRTAVGRTQESNEPAAFVHPTVLEAYTRADRWANKGRPRPAPLFRFSRGTISAPLSASRIPTYV